MQVLTKTKLNIGCGADKRPDYINVDLQERFNPDIVADMHDLSMFESDYFDEILANDCLEHTPRCDTEIILKEWARVLKHNGKLFLRVPNIIGVLELFNREENCSLEKQMLIINCIYGTQSYVGDWHLTSFTYDIIVHYLTSAGFTVDSVNGKDHWLFEIEATKI